MVEIMTKVINKEFVKRFFSSIILALFLAVISIIGIEAYKVCTVLLSYFLISELETLFKKKKLFLYFSR